MAAERVGAAEPVVDGAASAAAGLRRVQRGWYFYDWANSVFSTTVVTVFLGPYLTSVAEAAADADGYVHPLGLPVRAGAFFPYAVSASVLLSVLVMPVAGAVADRTGRHRTLMGVAAYLGAGATAAMFLLRGDRYLLGGALLVLANVAFAVSAVLYNSFLPAIAPPEQRDAVSSRGWAFGYAGGALLLVLNLVLYEGRASFGVAEGDAVRICLASAGVWWAGFTLIPMRRLPERAGVPGAAPVAGGGLGAGFRQLRGTLAEMRRYPLTLFFLAGYLCYNDGVQTVISQASLYGSRELGMAQGSLVVAVLMVQVLAIGGALLLGRLARRYGAKRAILGSLVAWGATVALGFALPAHRPVWFFSLAALIGLVMGGSQALSRSLFSQLVPPGKEAEYFSVYEVSDRGTSWLGPLVFGIAYQATGSYRVAIVSLVLFFAVGFALLLRLPVRRAIAAAGNPVPERV
ncbi:MFS transporter [Streptomyces sp. NPDC092296]|uniref:MFS transporter n=1 Tax=Streptomyces sp. NPDC092296 TaxID=3366012 RepID=UPI00380A0937